MKKLRVGFLIDDLQPNQYVIDLIDFVADNKYFDAPVLITGYNLKSSKTFTQKLIDIFKKNPIQFVNNIFRIIFLRIIRIIEIKIVLKRFPKYKTNDEETILKSYEIIKVAGTLSKSDLFLEFTDKDLSLISNHNLDCIIRCGSGILKGEVLNLTEFGVISFHHGDNRVNRGGPSGFWEVFKGEPSSGFIIQKLNQELDGGQVLYRGNLMTLDLWLANNAQLLEKSNVFLMRLLLDLAINRELPKPEGIRLHGNKLYKLPSTTVLFKYLLIIIIPKIFERIVSRLLSPKVKRWSVAYANHNEHNKSLWRYIEVKNPKGRYLADPFVFYHNESNYIFVEDLFCKDDKGRISAIKIDGDKYEFLGVVLEEDFHLSFPFIFRDNDEIYMIPESCKNYDIRLYKCLEFPNKWKLEQVLMSNVSAADTMLIKQQDTWFMLTNICSAGYGDHNSELHIFYSEDLKSNLWKPITSGNPVIFDSLKARNGGLFFHNETIYRVNQVHEKTNYGKSFNVNEVVKISKNEYVEKKISSIGANFKDKIISTHHYSANASLAAVDFARYQRLKKAYKK
jgi:hypothetical protein|tara:strand:+ start:1089 stop:2783 length:1695 start_codon:yes stop_codon:yes gene_type:complete